MPMAGLGTRTKSFSPNPKPFIDIKGIPLFKFALRGLPLDICTKLTFVLNENDRDFYISRGKQLLDAFTPADIPKRVVFTQTTTGQAATVHAALIEEDLNIPLLIASCDTMVTGDFPSDYEQWDGLLGTFWSDSPAMSYVRLSGDNVVETAEKLVISNNASSGLYFFRHGRTFQEVFQLSEHSGESYVAPLYNLLVNKQLKVGVWSHGLVTPLGTAQELKDFESTLDESFLFSLRQNHV